MELMLLIGSLLAPKDAATVQKVVGLYFGGFYWRSRTPALFHEVRDLKDKTLDWEYLCLELIRLESEDKEQLQSRRHVLAQLDEIAALTERGSQKKIIS